MVLERHILHSLILLWNCVKLLLVIVLIPRNGIAGYLIALLVGQLIIAVMDSIHIIRNINFSF